MATNPPLMMGTSRNRSHAGDLVPAPPPGGQNAPPAGQPCLRREKERPTRSDLALQRERRAPRTPSGNGVPRRGAVAITGRRLRGRPARWVATAHAPRAVARPRRRPARAAARWEAVGGYHRLLSELSAHFDDARKINSWNPVRDAVRRSLPCGASPSPLYRTSAVHLLKASDKLSYSPVFT